MRCPAAVIVAVVLGGMPSGRAGDVGLERRDDRIDVAIDGEPFTSYVLTGHRKPILFPVLGPGGVSMTRSWPMVGDVAGEPHDHPHHESIWFSHGQVNGVDFWASHPRAGKPERRTGDRVEHVDVVRATGGDEGLLETLNRWVRADGTVVCTDTRRLVFAGDAAVRSIEYTITIRADHGPVTLGDTKEGSMGLRLPVTLQLRDAAGSQGAAGHCINSEGRRDDEAWGGRARWVDYWGPVAGRTVGVAMLDHPGNLRHPTMWHARDYGLLAANPFGLHDFSGAPSGTGDHTIPAGRSLTLRYLIAFHAGDAEAAGIEGIWRRWTAAPAADPAPEQRP